jgi:hypothetical protein
MTILLTRAASRLPPEHREEHASSGACVHPIMGLCGSSEWQRFRDPQRQPRRDCGQIGRRTPFGFDREVVASEEPNGVARQGDGTTASPM